MYRIRFHGRGGQGMKTAGRILGTAFFLAGFEVQDAPRYGAERRGAPIFAYVRASKSAINERGIIRRPDLVIVADDTLVTIPAAGVLSGVTEHTVFLIKSAETPEVWKERLNFPGLVLPLLAAAESGDVLELRYIGAVCTGAAAHLVGVIPRESLVQAIQDELAHLGEDVVAKDLDKALEAYDLLADHAGCVTEGKDPPADAYEEPSWIEVPFEEADIAAPIIHAPATSEQVPTGLWRTMRPVIDYDRCKRCAWICSTLCPDSTISVNEEGYPEIDYQHCKGCLICMSSCPSHAIRAIPEQEAAAAAGGGSQT
ncbi:MAG: 2-oxoacid:acceptor oxidoreductase family protein [Syntrophobacterales bacterium]|jgi:pyruvate ferredoxin oxidoreductase gamma subunit